MPGVGLNEGKGGTMAPDTTALRNLEALSSDAERFHEAFQHLLSYQSGLVVLGAVHGVIPSEQVDHFNDDWFPEQRDRGLWPDLQPIEAEFRRGLVKAFTLAIMERSRKGREPRARRTPLPIQAELDPKTSGGRRVRCISRLMPSEASPTYVELKIEHPERSQPPESTEMLAEVRELLLRRDPDQRG